jgi:hypothetical protein
MTLNTAAQTPSGRPITVIRGSFDRQHCGTMDDSLILLCRNP